MEWCGTERARTRVVCRVQVVLRGFSLVLRLWRSFLECVCIGVGVFRLCVHHCGCVRLAVSPCVGMFVYCVLMIYIAWFIIVPQLSNDCQSNVTDLPCVTV